MKARLHIRCPGCHAPVLVAQGIVRSHYVPDVHKTWARPASGDKSDEFMIDVRFVCSWSGAEVSTP